MKKMRQIKIEARATNRTDNINRYFQEVAKSAPLSSEEEIKIAKRIANGDRAAEKILIEANLRFVISIAKQYTTHPDSMQELVSQGNIGLIEAARTFDHTRGFKFISYAVFHIRKEILDYFGRTKRTIRIPGSATLDLSRIRRAEESLTVDLGREPSAEEISEELTKLETPITASRIVHLKFMSDGTTALEWSTDEDSLSPIQRIDSMEKTDSELINKDNAKIISQLLTVLTTMERDVVTRRCGIGTGSSTSFGEIADTYGKSSEWARQTYNKAIRKIKYAASRTNISDDLINS